MKLTVVYSRLCRKPQSGCNTLEDEPVSRCCTVHPTCSQGYVSHFTTKKPTGLQAQCMPQPGPTMQFEKKHPYLGRSIGAALLFYFSVTWLVDRESRNKHKPMLESNKSSPFLMDVFNFWIHKIKSILEHQKQVHFNSKAVATKALRD